MDRRPLSVSVNLFLHKEGDHMLRGIRGVTGVEGDAGALTDADSVPVAKLVSIVVPVYNEAENIVAFYKRICEVMEATLYSFELLFVDDGSQDASVVLLDKICQADGRVRMLVLSRNFGHQTALTCGLDHAAGDVVITMDGDFQHPPELLPVLLEQWEAGFEVVQTVRLSTEGVSFFKQWTSAAFYRIMNAMSTVKIVEGGSDFRLLDQKAVRAFCLFRERARFIRGMVSSMGFLATQLAFVAPPRRAGVSKFSLRKMLHFALDGITAFSRLPLRFALYAGVLCGLISLGITVHVLYVKMLTQEAVPGWATIAASISFFGGLQLVGLGVVGEYVGRVFDEVKHRPLYFVRIDSRDAN